jgi:hypothetical protein
MHSTVAGLAVVLVLWSCAKQQVTNAPPAILEDCQREVAILTDRAISPVQDDPLRGAASETGPQPIEDARAAREGAGGAGLTTWPEEALLYRCLRSRGVQLTVEQAEMLSDWEGEVEQPDSSRPTD